MCISKQTGTNIMLLINIDTDGLIKGSKFPNITQLSAVDKERNIIISATITNDAPFEVRLINGVPANGIHWQQILPLFQTLLVNYPDVYFWDEQFDRRILEHHGVDFSNNKTHSIKTDKSQFLTKPDTVPIKGYQTLGKCFHILNYFFPLSEDDINLDF